MTGISKFCAINEEIRVTRILRDAKGALNTHKIRGSVHVAHNCMKLLWHLDE